MNYLSHFWLDEYRGDAAFSVGGALPDLSRLRGKGFRLRPGVPESVALNPLQESVEAGIARHYAIDAHWHNAGTFARLESVVRQGMEAAGISLRRNSFAAHIGAEMLLDRALLRRDPALAERFYRSFSPDILAEAYQLVALKGHEAWLGRLETGIQAFVKRRFLADYAGEYLADTWPDIYRHVTGDEAGCRHTRSQWLDLVESLTAAIGETVDFEALYREFA